MSKRYDYVEHMPSSDKVFKVDGHEIGDLSTITTHTLRRWLRKAKKMGSTGYSVRWGELAQDIIRVLGGEKP